MHIVRIFVIGFGMAAAAHLSPASAMTEQCDGKVQARDDDGRVEHPQTEGKRRETPPKVGRRPADTTKKDPCRSCWILM